MPHYGNKNLTEPSALISQSWLASLACIILEMSQSLVRSLMAQSASPQSIPIRFLNTNDMQKDCFCGLKKLSPTSEMFEFINGARQQQPLFIINSILLRDSSTFFSARLKSSPDKFYLGPVNCFLWRFSSAASQGMTSPPDSGALGAAPTTPHRRRH